MNELKKVKNDLKELEKKLSPFLDSFLKHKELQKQEPENQPSNSENTEAVEQESINVDPKEEQIKNEPAETPVLKESEENNETATPETQIEDEVEEKTPLEGNVEAEEEKESTEKQANEEKAKLEKEQKIKEIENEILSISLKMPFGESIQKNEELYEKMKGETISEFAPLVEFAYKQLEKLNRMRELKSELERIKEPETKIIQNSEDEKTESLRSKISNLFKKKEIPTESHVENKESGGDNFSWKSIPHKIFKNKTEERGSFTTEIEGEKINLNITEKKYSFNRASLFSVLLRRFGYKKLKNPSWAVAINFPDKEQENKYHLPLLFSKVDFFNFEGKYYKEDAKRKAIELGETIKNTILKAKNEDPEKAENTMRELIEDLKEVKTGIIWNSILQESTKNPKKFKSNLNDYDFNFRCHEMFKLDNTIAKILVKNLEPGKSLDLEYLEELSPETAIILAGSNCKEIIFGFNFNIYKLSTETIGALAKFNGIFVCTHDYTQNKLKEAQEKYREHQKNQNEAN